MEMYLAGVATKVAHVNVMQEVGISMVDRAIDQAELMGDQIAMMIQATQILPPSDGSTFDVRV